MFIKRKLSKIIINEGIKFPVIGIFGPRQSGKTTLAKEIFKKYKYVSLEDLDVQELAKEDPRRFLEKFDNEKGVILDEVQNTPELFSYLQGVVDSKKRPGFFVLTGSQNFLLNQQISQSLAGRIAIFTLLPFSIQELNIKSEELRNLMFNGFYPRIYSENLNPKTFYKNYIRTYLERDVRLIKNVTNLGLFQTFLKLCAGRTGQLLNYNSLSDDVGVSVNTIKGWISLLEQSYIVFLLRPHYKNFGKRLIKTPKLFFYDTGVACSLLEIENPDSLYTHYLRGNLFENFVISEITKQHYNKDVDPNLHFWRNQSGNEIDCIIEKGQNLTALEIKSGKTINSSFFDGLKYWQTLSKTSPKDSFLIYAGDENQKRSIANVVSWRDLKF